MQPVIIIPAFSRPDALKRLLGSVNEARFNGSDTPELIISLDGGADQKVTEIADAFEFKHGIKRVIKREENLGLDNHILWCGDQSQKYGSIILLEDDIYVDKYFYEYARKAVQFYQDDKRIAGIALYSPKYCQITKLGFEPMRNGYSVYFKQNVCTWGQAWTAKQWSGFREWYSHSDEKEIDKNDAIPKTVKSWKSWDKFFSAYMVDKNLYFVFPYISYSTNCADPGGVHMSKGSDRFHVPLSAKERPERDYYFCSFDTSTVKYDAFSETEAKEVYDSLNISSADLDIDIYGIKPMSLLKKKYVLTSKKCKHPIQVFRLGFRPVEKIVMYPVTDYQPGSYNRNFVYLAETENILAEKRPFFEQVNYASYYQTENKFYFRRYLLNTLRKYTKFI